MAQLQQTQRGQQGEQGAIGQCTRIVHGLRLAPEGQGCRLSGFRPGQMKGGIPDRRHGDAQQTPEGQAYREQGAQDIPQQQDGPGTKPVWQQPRLHRQTSDDGLPPGAATFRHR